MRVMYWVLRPFYPALQALAPRHVTTTTNIGRAMIRVARVGYSSPILENDAINTVARQ